MTTTTRWVFFQPAINKLNVVIAECAWGRLACASGNAVLILDLSSSGFLPSFLHYTMGLTTPKTNVTTAHAYGSLLFATLYHPNRSREGLRFVMSWGHLYCQRSQWTCEIHTHKFCRTWAINAGCLQSDLTPCEKGSHYWPDNRLWHTCGKVRAP